MIKTWISGYDKAYWDLCLYDMMRHGVQGYGKTHRDLTAKVLSLWGPTVLLADKSL